MKAAAVVLASGLMALASAAVSAGRGPVLHISSHLPTAARVSIDGRPPVTAPGEGQVETPITPGTHSLKVTGDHGVSYQGRLALDPAQIMRWHGRGYWCVNLLDHGLQPYSRDECEMDVTDAG